MRECKCLLKKIVVNKTSLTLTASFKFESEFQTVTAGKFKRSLTPTKKVTQKDLDKAKDDVEGILVQFASFVKQNRPNLDVDSVATGETWFGQAAVEKGLCDEIKPVDDVLLNYVDLGYNVYEVEYSPPPQVPEGLAGLLPLGQATSSENNVGRKIIRWVVETVAAEVRSVIGASDSAEKYMAKDDTADRVQARDR
jgi:ClpP class serine protease